MPRTWSSHTRTRGLSSRETKLAVASPTASLFITNTQSLLKFISIELVMPSNHLILCRPFLLLPSIFPNIRVFSSESDFHIRWPEYWSFSFNISPSNEHSRLISFRMDWLDILTVQGTLNVLITLYKSLIYSLRLSVLYCKKTESLDCITSISSLWFELGSVVGNRFAYSTV